MSPQLENETSDFDIHFTKIEEKTVKICQNIIPVGTPIDVLASTKLKRFWYFDIIAQIGGDKEGYGRPSYEIPKISTMKKKRKENIYAEKFENIKKIFKNPNYGELHEYSYSTELVTADYIIDEDLYTNLQFMYWAGKNTSNVRNNRRKFIKELTKKYPICYLLCPTFVDSFPQEIEGEKEQLLVENLSRYPLLASLSRFLKIVFVVCIFQFFVPYFQFVKISPSKQFTLI